MIKENQQGRDLVWEFRHGSLNSPKCDPLRQMLSLSITRKYLTKEEADTFYGFLVKLKAGEGFTEDDILHYNFMKDRVQDAAIRMLDHGAIGMESKKIAKEDSPPSWGWASFVGTVWNWFARIPPSRESAEPHED